MNKTYSNEDPPLDHDDKDMSRYHETVDGCLLKQRSGEVLFYGDGKHIIPHLYRYAIVPREDYEAMEAQLANQQSIECWVLIHDGEVTSHEEEMGIGIVNGVDFQQVLDMKHEMFCYMQDALEEIPEGALSASFVASNFTWCEEQRSFAPPVQPDIPACWEMEMKVLGFHIESFKDEPIFKEV